MSIQTLREFINRHNPSAAGLAALAAALDVHANGTPMDPALAARIEELLATLGAGDVLDDVSPQEAAPFLADIRSQLGFNAKLLHPQSQATCWNYADDQLLQEAGDFARSHAHGLTRNVIPALDGLPERIGTAGAAFLDIGVGVAGLAVALAEQWPDLRIVGIDVWQPSLRLARENVEKAGLRDRIELREQGAENLEDDKAFDLAWMPIVFMPERVIPEATKRTHRALRPGGWVVFAFPNFESGDAQTAAFWRLRTTMWGGPLWTPSEVEKVARDHGFVDVRTMPAPPGVHVALVAGRRRSA
jgi:SAM-dependent methyltransferase